MKLPFIRFSMIAILVYPLLPFDAFAAKLIARKLQEGPLAAQRAFRMYANDEALSREGAQTSLYEPPSRREAFDAAFGVEEGAKRSEPKAQERGTGGGAGLGA